MSGNVVQKSAMNPRQPLSVIYFGIYSKDGIYPRNKNILKALRGKGCSVREIHADLAGSFHDRMRIARHPVHAAVFLARLITGYFRLAAEFLRSSPAQVIIVGHPGYFHVHLAAWLRRFRNKRALLLYDLFIPLHDAVVDDRKIVSSGGPFSRLLKSFEGSGCRQADLCLIDTRCHGSYLARAYGIPTEKIGIIPVGPTIENAYKKPASITANPVFTVLYVGTYIPLHGVDVILQAAEQLNQNDGIRFIMAGTGQLRLLMEMRAKKRRLKNVIFRDWIPLSSLGNAIRTADLCLGIFGRTDKALRVIPSKIYDICTAGQCFVTADTPAVREVFSHGKNAYLVPPADPAALSVAILDLKARPELRRLIAAGAHATARRLFTSDAIGRILLSIASGQRPLR